jgi:hypothetical protein
MAFRYRESTRMRGYIFSPRIRDWYSRNMVKVRKGAE